MFFQIMEFSFATNNGPLFISNDQNCSLSICNKKKLSKIYSNCDDKNNQREKKSCKFKCGKFLKQF